MSTLIRLATENDVQAAFKLMAELGYPGLSLARFAETYRAVLEHPAMLVVLAEDENEEVIGLASISNRPQLRLTGNLVTIDEFVIAANARGKGVGRELLNGVVAMAEKLGARRLELETNRARESYRREFYVKTVSLKPTQR
jgi:N-acetylglutamate synthase-like GNAT family acetyltransferase